MKKKTDLKTQLIQKDYSQEIEEDILNYSLSAIVRAIPDARDGLKPVHRRILYAMKTDHNTFDKPYRKSVKGVGATMSRFHPHGDSSVYDAMIRMAQDFKMRHTLIDAQGNVGSIDGDSWAASRYVETRLTELSETLLEDIEKGVVPMVDNFDATEKEPLVLPARFPHVLVNGTQGIAVGIATNIPTHNLGEVIDAFIYFMEHKKVSLQDILKIMPGPDFPTGGIIINKDSLIDMYRTGVGKVITRAKMRLEQNKNGKDSLIITEIPYSLSGSKNKIIDVVNELIIDHRLPEISEIRDESSKEGIRINLVLKKDLTEKELKNLENKLYKLTPLESSETYNFMMTVDLRPKQLSLLEYFKVYHQFQREITKNKYNYLISKYKERKEILDGLIEAINIIDVIVEIARYSKNNKAIKECLTKGDVSGISFKTKSFETKAKKLCFSERQALAIMAIRLEQLSGLEILTFKKELDDLNKKISQAEKIISSDIEIDHEIKKYMLDIKKRFATKRLTIITNSKQAEYKEERIVEKINIVIDKYGYIKLLNSANLSKLSSDEMTSIVFNKETNTEDKIALFSADGFMYTFKIEELLKTKTSSPRGILMDSLVNTKTNSSSKIIFYCLESDMPKLETLFVSSDGFIKRVLMNEFIISKTIAKTTNLNKNAQILNIFDISDKKELILTSSSQKTINRPINTISRYKKTSRGIIGIRLKENEKIEKVVVK